MAIDCAKYAKGGTYQVDFTAAYDTPTQQSRRYTATRVWSIFRRAAPSLELDPAYHRGDLEAEMESGYPDSWLREVIRARPDQFRLSQPEIPENALPY